MLMRDEDDPEAAERDPDEDEDIAEDDFDFAFLLSLALLKEIVMLRWLFIMIISDFGLLLNELFAIDLLPEAFYVDPQYGTVRLGT